MEVHSATRPAREGVTLAATASLMVLAVLLSLHVVNQKNHHWSSLLDKPVNVSAQLRLKVPSAWRSIPAQLPESHVWVGSLPGASGSFRLAIASVNSPRESMVEVLASQLNGVQGTPTEVVLTPNVCRFGRTRVDMNGIEWIDEKGQSITLRFIVGRVGEREVILSLRATGGSDETVKGVLRHIAASAEVSKPARVEENTGS